MDSVSKKTPDSMSKNPMDITNLAQRLVVGHVKGRTNFFGYGLRLFRVPAHEHERILRAALVKDAGSGRAHPARSTGNDNCSRVMTRRQVLARAAHTWTV